MLSWNEAAKILKEIMDFSAKINIKETFHINLILKKSRVVFFLRKIRESELALNEAEQLLKVLKQNKKNYI